MDKQPEIKVAVATDIALKTPNVVVSDHRPDKDENKDEAEAPEKSKNIFVAIGKSIINFFMDFLETIVVALSVFVVVYLFLVQPHEVKGSSMEPNFHDSEYILTDKISYRFVEPKRGDVIIFKAPRNPDVDYIKRVIGLPGDKVKVEAGYVYVNGKKLNEYYLKDNTLLFAGSFMQEGVEITVPDGQYFVMGDNRPHSSDSREFGTIEQKSIIGRAVVRYWPIPEIGVIPAIKY